MYWYNLTQCAGFDGRKLYLRSTDVEQMNWHRLLWSVPDELLFELASGTEVTIRDRSSNRTGKIERIFLPVFQDVLRWMWFDLPPSSLNFYAHYEAAVEVLKLDSALHAKYRYWKRLSPVFINLNVETLHVDKEENPI